MRQRLLVQARVIPDPGPRILMENLARQWCQEFNDLRRARLEMGYFRYGAIKSIRNPGRRHGYSIGEIARRLGLYIQTGNAELLVDIANFCEVEFVLRSHPRYHFQTIERNDDGSHS